MSKKLNLILFFLVFGITLERDNSVYYNKNPDYYLGKEMGLNEQCSDTNCPSPHSCGTDNSITACVCDKKYANYPFTGEEGQYCTYKRKRQIVAFLWELFLNVGIGHYYIRQILRGVLKSIIMGVPVLIFVLGKMHLIKNGFNEGTTGTVMAVIMIVFAILAFAWWVLDIVLFGLNKYRDNNDVPLQHW